MASSASWTHSTLDGVFAPPVQRLPAQLAVRPTVLANRTRRADLHAEPVPKNNLEVPVRHALRDVVLPKDRWLKEPAGARASAAAEVNLVVLGQFPEQFVLQAFTSLDEA